MKTRPLSARDKLRNFFLANVGRVVRTQQLREVAGISEYARRIRELRDEEGMLIRTHKERSDLRPDEYVLESAEFAPVADPRIPDDIRKMALQRDGPRCRFCGMGRDTGNHSSIAPRPRLRIDYLNPPEEGGMDEVGNVAVICASCAKGRRKTRRSGQSARELLAHIRRASPAVQREVYQALKRSFDRAADV